MISDVTGAVTMSTASMSSGQSRITKPLGDLSLEESSGWIVWNSFMHRQEESLRLCWIPAELRGYQSACHEGVFVVASDLTHQLTIIDFTPMLLSLGLIL
jgi:hypothetical protein